MAQLTKNEKKEKELMEFVELAKFYKEFFRKRDMENCFLTDTYYGHLALDTQRRLKQARKEVIEEIKKELDRWVGICACDEAYKIRDLIDPSCDYHKYEGFFDWLDTLK